MILRVWDLDSDHIWPHFEPIIEPSDRQNTRIDPILGQYSLSKCDNKI